MPLAKPEDIDDEPAEDSGSEAVEGAGGPVMVHDPVTGEETTIQNALETLRDRMKDEASVPRGEAEQARELANDLAAVVDEQRALIEDLRADVAALYEAVGTRTEYGYAVQTSDGATWVPSSSDQFSPTGEFK